MKNEILINEILAIQSEDFWEDVMLNEYLQLIDSMTKKELDEFYEDVINTINKQEYSPMQLGFLIDILSYERFESASNFDTILKLSDEWEDDHVLEKTIDGLRSWTLSDLQKKELFSLSRKIKNKNSLIFLIISEHG